MKTTIGQRRVVYLHAAHGNLYEFRGHAFIWATLLFAFCIARIAAKLALGL